MNKSDIKAFFKSMYSYLEHPTLDEIIGHCDYIKLSKGTELIQGGKRHNFFYFIYKGGVKSYHLNEGKEICSWFAFENEVASTFRTWEGQFSNETIELLEDSELIRINTKAFKTLAETKISVSRLINELLSEHAVFLEELIYIKSKPSKERYDMVIKTEPQLLQRVSVTDLASFLSMSRETLSRIRAKK